MRFWSVVFVFLITFSLILLFRPIALRCRLVDRPGGRKIHQGPVPLVGGLAMFGGLSPLCFFPVFSPEILCFVLLSAFAVFAGLLDDRRGLCATRKFALQIIAALLMIGCGGVVLKDLGDLLSWGPAVLGVWSVPFTVFAAVGVMNAMNMVDGMDGLAGGLTLIAFACLALIALIGGRTLDAWLLGCLIAAVLAFLCFNLRWSDAYPARIFMGDAGSLLLGFLLAWFTIHLSQGVGRAMTPVTALWVLAVPLLDTGSVMLRRMLSGKSPFDGDRQHLHHLLLDLGYSTHQTLSLILGMAAVFALVGVGGLYFHIPEAKLFFAFLGVAGIYFTALYHAGKILMARRRHRSVPRQLDFTGSLILNK